MSYCAWVGAGVRRYPTFLEAVQRVVVPNVSLYGPNMGFLFRRDPPFKENSFGFRV